MAIIEKMVQEIHDLTKVPVAFLTWLHVHNLNQRLAALNSGRCNTHLSGSASNPLIQLNKLSLM